MTAALGWENADELPVSLATHMEKFIRDEPFDCMEGVLHHEEGVDLIPGNIELAGMEVSLVNAMRREITMKSCLKEIKEKYDYILIDCMSSLGMLTINAFAASDSVIIPVQAHYLSAKGMTQLVKTVTKVQRQINPRLRVVGVLLTLADMRTNLAKDTESSLRQNYGRVLKIYNTIIPVSIKATETSAVGKSIYVYDKGSKAAKTYEEFAPEVLRDGERQRNQSKSSRSR